MANSQATMPAPIGGWNARDDHGAMPSNQAIVLDNWFPQTSWVGLRRGFAPHATGLPGAVETLMSYSSGGTEKLLAASGGTIFEVTASGAVGAPLASGLTSNRWQSVQFRGSLIAVNGADSPSRFDGSAWTPTAFDGTGLDPTRLIQVNVFKSRLFLVEKDCANYWFAPVNYIAGTLSKVDLSSLAPHGGVLVAMATWSRDGGAGQDDLAVFLMSGGDVIVYAGTDPGDAANWSLTGVFHLGNPIGRRCFFKLGSDVVIITQDGYVPLSRLLPTGRSEPRLALSDAISGAVAEAARNFGHEFGWQPILYPRGNFGLFNVPRGGGVFHQHVINTITLAWCRFTGLNGHCWAVHGERLYFGDSDGRVCQADTGKDDAGADIAADGKTSFQSFGSSAIKRFTLVRPVLAADGALQVSLGLDVDYHDKPITYDPSPATSGAAQWDVSAWDEFPWSAVTPITAWRSVVGVGSNCAVRVRTATRLEGVRWHALDIRFELGSGL
ncbi:MAG: hypothetical protein HQL82_10840 [Magnetococcales bacterium]|nr:hypothetical protein [Magnetococcales bacterium]